MGVERTISNFIRALRNAEVRVSTAETLDAMSVVELVGYEDKAHLKRSLSLALPKTADEKNTFDACFDSFFQFQDVRGETANDSSSESEQEGEESDEGGDGEGGGAGGDPQNQNRGKKKSKSKSKQNNLFEEEEEADLGPGEITDAHSPLGKLLMANSRVELAQSMAEAGEAINVREIQIFTQKGPIRAAHHGPYGPARSESGNQRFAHGLASSGQTTWSATQAASRLFARTGARLRRAAIHAQRRCLRKASA
jgi:uncharacterized protein with von Willebrand factor type A (vWA) domain